MKKNITILFAFIMSCSIAMAQGNSGNKGKGKNKDKDLKESKSNKSDKADKESKSKHNSVIWDGTSNEGNSGCKVSKNQPRKVRDNFRADYPNARNVQWCKYRGDWTATFSNTLFGRSTAVYHANGERKDTRSVFPWSKAPEPVIRSVETQKPSRKLSDIIKIEIPRAGDIFRIPLPKDNRIQYIYLNADGDEVKYDY